MAPYEELAYILGGLSAGAFVAWLLVRYASDRARERERRARLIEAQILKFAEAREFIEFARSDVGLNWLKADSGELRALRALLVLTLVGILTLALGAGLWINAAHLAAGVEQNDRASAAWWGTVLVALGIGTLLAAAVLARIAHSWGLIPSSRFRRKSPGGG